MDQAISGFPPTMRMFLSRMDFDPDLAGITARTKGLLDMFAVPSIKYAGHLQLAVLCLPVQRPPAKVVRFAHLDLMLR